MYHAYGIESEIDVHDAPDLPDRSKAPIASFCGKRTWKNVRPLVNLVGTVCKRARSLGITIAETKRNAHCIFK